MSDEKRIYRKSKRAELEEETHVKITESAVALHGSIGPANTTVSAIAEHAGVRRSTVYRHFPDDAAIFRACSSHWMSLNPLPDPAAWAANDDLQNRRLSALTSLYEYFRKNETMLHNVLRDEPVLPALQAVMVAYHGYLKQILLLLQSKANGRKTLSAAAIGHALNFFSWRSMAIEQGLSDLDSAKLMCGMIERAETP